MCGEKGMDYLGDEKAGIDGELIFERPPGA